MRKAMYKLILTVCIIVSLSGCETLIQGGMDAMFSALDSESYRPPVQKVTSPKTNPIPTSMLQPAPNPEPSAPSKPIPKLSPNPSVSGTAQPYQSPYIPPVQQPERSVQTLISIAPLLEETRGACNDLDWSRVEHLGKKAGNTRNAYAHERAEGFVLAGAAAFIQGNRSGAREYFVQAVRVCPSITLNEQLFTAEIVRLFNDVKQSETR